MHAPHTDTISRSEVDGLATLLLVTAKLEVLAALERHLVLGLARGALEAEDDLLGLLSATSAARTHSLGLLVEDGLGLATVTALLPVVTTLALGGERVLALLVLSDLVGRVLLAGLALAEGATGPGG